MNENLETLEFYFLSILLINWEEFIACWCSYFA